jgi:hypothetical protein
MCGKTLFSWGMVFLMVPVGAVAQSADEIADLRKQLQELRDKMRLVEQQLERFEQKSDSPAVTKSLPAAAVPAPTAAASAAPVPAAEEPWSPAAPLRLLGNERSFLNLSLDAMFAAGGSSARDVERLQFGGHDPHQRGFTVQNLETTLEGVVDPYFRGQAALVYQIDPAGESVFELEEAYGETLSLPAGLQIRAGQYFSEFGRLNPQHPHSWDFVDQPIVNGRFLGGDGLRGTGARLSWLMPVPFYSELWLGIQNSQGETLFSFRNEHEDEPYLGRLHSQRSVRGLGDMLFVPRYATSFELTDAQTLVLGASAALGPNGSARSADSQVLGLDAYWKWKPATHHGGFPFVSWHTEAMFRRYEAGAFDWDRDRDGLLGPGEPDDNSDGTPDVLRAETLKDWGLFSQVLWGIKKGWVLGLRGEYVGRINDGDYESLYGPDPDRGGRSRVSPNLTWYPSEFSKLRLQYNLDHREEVGKDHSVWLQFEFLLGAHAAHKF